MGVDRRRWAQAFTSAGWACVVAYMALIVAQVDRARRTNDAGFRDGVWGQRLEVLSFIAWPQQLVPLLAAAGVAVATAFLGEEATDHVAPWHQRLVRVTAGVALVAIALALLDMLVIIVENDDSVGGVSDIVLRLAGVALAWAIVRVCLEAERMDG